MKKKILVRISQIGFVGLLSAAVFSFAQSDNTKDSSEYKSPVQYFDLPPNVTPLDGLLPSGGIGQSNSLMSSPRNIIQDHEIDVGTRSLEVKEKYVNPLSKDTTELWSASYPELADYVNDMYDIGLNRLWLNSLIGNKNDGYTPPEKGSA